MAVKIRLKRMGGKNDPHFRVVVADKRSPRDGRFIEEIGTYNPKIAGSNFNINIERARHWMKQGAVPSDTVRSLLKQANKAAQSAP